MNVHGMEMIDGENPFESLSSILDQTNNNNNNATQPPSLDTASSDDSFSWTAANICLSLFLFVVAGICEVGGGYLMWLGVREKKTPSLFIPLGAVVLIVYGIIPTFQPVNDFGRVYAVYGGFFILLSYLWGYLVDGMALDLGDYVGTAIALSGVAIAWFWPR